MFALVLVYLYLLCQLNVLVDLLCLRGRCFHIYFCSLQSVFKRITPIYLIKFQNASGTYYNNIPRLLKYRRLYHDGQSTLSSFGNTVMQACCNAKNAFGIFIYVSLEVVTTVPDLAHYLRKQLAASSEVSNTDSRISSHALCRLILPRDNVHNKYIIVETINTYYI